jgi:prepilin-type N-terminal cleavage/methylation domain-containing protein
MKKPILKKGFGIVEVLIASSIIAVIIFALTAAGKSALRS